jgi:transcription initiation factor TFIIIB Brf1 subunit/transcription initiation factor TFIIB
VGILKKYWFLVVFAISATGAAYTLQAEQKNTKETVKEVKEEVKETKEEIKENEEKITEEEKINIEQTITLKYIQQTLEKLNLKIDNDIKKEGQ